MNKRRVCLLKTTTKIDQNFFLKKKKEGKRKERKDMGCPVLILRTLTTNNMGPKMWGK